MRHSTPTVNVITPKAQKVVVGSLHSGCVFTTDDPLTTYIVLGDVYTAQTTVFNFNSGRITHLYRGEFVTPAKITRIDVTQFHAGLRYGETV